MKSILTLISAITAILAAGFWFWSSAVEIPNLMDTKLSGKGSITDIMRKQSRLSAIAAIFAAIAAITQTIAQYLN